MLLISRTQAPWQPAKASIEVQQPAGAASAERKAGRLFRIHGWLAMSWQPCPGSHVLAAMSWQLHRCTSADVTIQAKVYQVKQDEKTTPAGLACTHLSQIQQPAK